MNNITNFKAKRWTFILVVLAIFTALFFPLAPKSESLSKTFAQSVEAAKVYVNASSSGNDGSAELGAYNIPIITL